MQQNNGYQAKTSYHQVQEQNDNLDLEIDDEEDFSIDDNQTDPRWDGLQSIIDNTIKERNGTS